MKKYKKRIFLKFGFVIFLCMIEYFVGFSFSSRANTRILPNATQISQEERHELERQALERQALETQALEEENLDTTEVRTEAEIESTRVEEAKTAAEDTSSTTAPTRVRTLSSEVIAYDGLLRSITCWGDSLTEGIGTGPNYPILTNIKVNGVSTNINGKTMPSTLGELTNLTVYNMGVSGEDSRTIACRQGGLKMYVNDITIPDSGSVSISQIVCEDGYLVDPNINGSYGEKECFDACSIGGIVGKLSYDWNAETFLFTRIQDGSELVISIYTPIITPPSIERKGDILILQMGNNGGYLGDYDVLIAQYDAMIEYNQCKYYIIVGDTDYSAAYRADWENALELAYGDHFINMRQYLVDFVSDGWLKELEIPESFDDFIQLENGEVPYSLKVWDESHLNSYGYWIEGNAIYDKGCELGYWGY